MASTAPSANPGRCLRSGVLGPPPLPCFRLARSVGVGPGRLGPVRRLGRTRSLAPYRVVSAWLSRAVVPSCREFHGVLRRRRQSARRRPCAAYAVSALCLVFASLVQRPGLGPLARAGRETGSRRGLAPLFGSAGALPAVDPPLPLGGSALRTLSASSWVAGAARLAGPVQRRSGRGCVSPIPSGPLVRALAYG